MIRTSGSLLLTTAPAMCSATKWQLWAAISSYSTHGFDRATPFQLLHGATVGKELLDGAVPVQDIGWGITSGVILREDSFARRTALRSHPGVKKMEIGEFLGRMAH